MTEENSNLEAAKFAVLNGLDLASQRFSFPKDELQDFISNLELHSLPLMRKAKQLIVDCALRKGAEAASIEWGLLLPHVESLVAGSGLKPLTGH